MTISSGMICSFSNPSAPDADDEAEQAERHRRQDEEGHHPERMQHVEGHEEARGEDDDHAEQDRLRRGPRRHSRPTVSTQEIGADRIS